MQSVKNTCNPEDSGSIPGVGNVPWRREWLPTPVFLPGEFYGKRSLVDYSPWGRKEVEMTEKLSLRFKRVLREMIAFKATVHL